MTLIFVFLIVSLCSMYHKEELLSICVEMGRIKSPLLWKPRKLGSDLHVATNTVSYY